MYYQTLLALNDKYGEDLIKKYDTWLYNMPKREDDRISIGKTANELQIEFVVAKNILEDSVELNMLIHRYAIKCPECNHVIELVSFEELYDTINSINNCDACENDDIMISDEDIQILYKKIENESKSSLKKKNEENHKKVELSSNDTLKAFIEDKIIKPNEIFYKPTLDEKENMVFLFNRIGTDAKNSTEKGEQLRGLVEYILRRVKIFEAANVRTATNELDCLVKNKLQFALPYFINELGSIVIVECKNEKGKPDNTYFHKLQGLLKCFNAKSGIIFAIQRPTRVVRQIANSNYLIDNTILISIDYEELREIVFNDLNFLDLLENKIVSLKIDSMTYIDDNKVFEETRTKK